MFKVTLKKNYKPHKHLQSKIIEKLKNMNRTDFKKINQYKKFKLVLTEIQIKHNLNYNTYNLHIYISLWLLSLSPLNLIDLT